MMKKIKTWIWVSLIVVALIISPMVSALNTNVKTLPNSPFIYWISVTIPEKIEMFFTFNQQDKLIKHTLIAEKRLVEIQKLNQINVPIYSSNINNYNGELDKIEEMINRGIISSEEARIIIENNLNRVKEKEKEIPIQLPIVLPTPEKQFTCGGFAGTKCPEGYRCTCDNLGNNCQFDKQGQCVKSKVEDIGDKISCAMIYDPVCGEDKNTYPNECVAKQKGITRVVKGACEETKKETCIEVCLYTGTANEGMYDSCSRKLIALKQCDFSSQKPIPNSIPNPPIESCNSDKDCQSKYRSCYFKCMSNKCSEIYTYVKLSDYPNCEEIKPTPVPTPEPIPLPSPIKTPIPQCSNDKICADTLRNCNAVCINNQCTIVNSFRPRGTYPNCDGYGVL